MSISHVERAEKTPGTCTAHGKIIRIFRDKRAKLKHWVKYSAYGVPFGVPGADTDSDGDCDSTDVTQIQTWIDAPAYDVRGDIDLDGDVDATDKSTVSTYYDGTTAGRDVLSALASIRSGYAG